MRMTCEQVVGASLIGITLASMLLGIVTVQTTIYLRRFKDDARLVRTLVPCLWVLSFLQLALVTCDLWKGFLRFFSRSDSKNLDLDWPLTLWQIIGVVSATCVQALYSWRIYQLNPKCKFFPVAPTLVVMTAALGLAATATMTVIRESNGVLTGSSKRASWMIPIWLGFNVMTDCWIAIVNGVLLWPMRTGFPSTDHIVKTLIIYGVNTGAMTCFISMGILVLIASNSFEFPVLLPGVPYGSLYCLGLLSNLLGRARLRSMIPPDETIPDTSKDITLPRLLPTI